MAGRFGDLISAFLTTLGIKRFKVPETFRIIGSARDSDGKPLEGVWVQALEGGELARSIHGSRLRGVKTGSKGRFLIAFRRIKSKESGLFPEVSLVMRDTTGEVLLQTPGKKNDTGSMEFHMKVGGFHGSPSEPDLYKEVSLLSLAQERRLDEALEVSVKNVDDWVAFVTSSLEILTEYRDFIEAEVGFEGIQVPAQPRRESHEHVTRWDQPDS